MTDPALLSVQDRVLWLATSIVHHANRVRPNSSGVKVGGHQASSASMVGIMTALWCDVLGPDDRVSVKPHASPVLHALSYLLGDLDPSYLTRLRDLGGLQPYPSRTKDPDRPHYSTGSVGLGATAPVWAAVTNRYLRSRGAEVPAGRQISLVGDAELDEGAVWECVADPMVSKLGEVLWVVDLNRQSLDRIVPDVQVAKWQGMFRAAGWQVLEAKYGGKLCTLFDLPGGGELRDRIDAMSNEEYQWLLRTPAPQLRPALAPEGSSLAKALADLPDEELKAALRDLGGHDLDLLSLRFREADDERPTVLFAYTVKGFGLPTEGHPANHSALMTDEQYAALAASLGTDPDDPWRRFDEGSAESGLLRSVAERLRPRQVPAGKVPAVPADVGLRHKGTGSTQEAFGRVLTELTRSAPEVAARVVTVSPDVASSTNMGGWINKVGVWSVDERTDWFASDPDRLLRWSESPHGQHLELGIAEVNLVSLLGELGASWLTTGEPLLPVGTVYDPFVARALEPWTFGVYAGGQSLLVGTPSGVTLAPEGGAHQSITTPSIALEQPGVTAFEPAFGADLEWCLLECLAGLGRKDGESAYLRLSTRPVDQGLSQLPTDEAGREQRRRDVLAGGYRLAADLPAQVTVAATGAVVPEACAAAEELASMGIGCDVVVVTSYDRLWRAFLARQGRYRGPERCVDEAVLDRLFPADRRTPLVTVVDGAPHTLAFLGLVTGTPVVTLGVSAFGQGGGLEQVLDHYGLDRRAVVQAALDAADL